MWVRINLCCKASIRLWAALIAHKGSYIILSPLFDLFHSFSSPAATSSPPLHSDIVHENVAQANWSCPLRQYRGNCSQKGQGLFCLDSGATVRVRNYRDDARPTEWMVKQYCNYQKLIKQSLQFLSPASAATRTAPLTRTLHRASQLLREYKPESPAAADYYLQQYMFIVEGLQPSVVVVNVLRVVRALHLKAELGQHVLGLDFALGLRNLWLQVDFLRERGGLLPVFGEDAVAVAVVLLEDIGDGGEADVVLLDQSGHLDLLDVVELCHIIFNLKLRVRCYIFADLSIGGALANVLWGEIVVPDLFLLLLHRIPFLCFEIILQWLCKRTSLVSERNIAVHSAFALAVLLTRPVQDLSPSISALLSFLFLIYHLYQFLRLSKPAQYSRPPSRRSQLFGNRESKGKRWFVREGDIFFERISSDSGVRLTLKPSQPASGSHRPKQHKLSKISGMQR